MGQLNSRWQRPGLGTTAGDHERRIGIVERQLRAPIPPTPTAWIHCTASSIASNSINDGATGISYRAWRFDFSSGDILTDTIGVVVNGSNNLELAGPGIFVIRATSRQNLPAQTATRQFQTVFAYSGFVQELPVDGRLITVGVPLTNGGPLIFSVPDEISILVTGTATVQVGLWESNSTGVLSSGRTVDVLIYKLPTE